MHFTLCRILYQNGRVCDVKLWRNLGTRLFLLLVLIHNPLHMIHKTMKSAYGYSPITTLFLQAINSSGIALRARLIYEQEIVNIIMDARPRHAARARPQGWEGLVRLYVTLNVNRVN